MTIDLRDLRIQESQFACAKPPERYRVLRCSKSLYKSTYKGNVFKKGHTYVVHPVPKTGGWTHLVFVIDETGHPFSFVRDASSPENILAFAPQLREYFDVESKGSTP